METLPPLKLSLLFTACHTSLRTSIQVSTFSALLVVVLLCSLTSQITNPLTPEWCRSSASESWAALHSNQQGKVLWSWVGKASPLPALEMIPCTVVGFMVWNPSAFAQTLVLGCKRSRFNPQLPCDISQPGFKVRLQPLDFNTHTRDHAGTTHTHTHTVTNTWRVSVGVREIWWGCYNSSESSAA